MLETYNPLLFSYRSKGFDWYIQKCLWVFEEKCINKAASIHAAEHAIISCLPKYIITGFNEIKLNVKLQRKNFPAEQQKESDQREFWYMILKAVQQVPDYPSKLFWKREWYFKDMFVQDCRMWVWNGCPTCGILVCQTVQTKFGAV